MATVKIKYRPSSVKDKEGTVYYQIIHNRVVRQLKTDYRIFDEEWNEKTATIKVEDTVYSDRENYLDSVQQRIDWDMKRLDAIIYKLGNSRSKYSADDVIRLFRTQADEHSLFGFMQSVIVRLKQMGKLRTSETYTATLKSFMKFRENKDLLLDEMDSDMMQMYEAWLRNRGLTKNSTSFYMRILRAVYNRAVEKEITENRYPFKHVYTGIDKTVKRAISLKDTRRIKNLDLSMRPNLDFARDMFMFSFYTRGMSFIDMAYLKKSDLQNGILTYRRRKTGQTLHIKWEKCMQEIIDKHNVNGYSPYLLPILKYPNEDTSRQYRNALHLTNNKLKEISTILELPNRFSMYVSRHSWASIAKSKNVPISVISEGLGHDSEATTQIYLASLETSIVDKANELILKSV